MRYLKPGLAALGLCLLGQPGSHAQDSQFGLNASLDSVIQQHVEQDLNMGAIVGVIQDGQTWVSSYGKISTARPQLPSGDTIFEIGSVGKVFTGLALGKLVTENKVRLDDPVHKFFPELAGTPAGQITLIELTTHASGLPRLPTNMKVSDDKNPYRDYQLPDLLDFLKSYKPTKPKPYPVEYSNLGVGLLGQVLAKAYGSDFETMIRELIAGPLGMPDTSVTLSPSQLGRTAQGHTSVLDETPLWDIPGLAGAGGIRSSLYDLLTFLRANLDPDSTPLGAAIRLSHQAHASLPDAKVGLGWFKYGSGEDEMIVHNGQTGGFYSLVAFKPKQRSGMVLLTNTSASIKCIGTLFSGESCELEKEHPYSVEQLDSYVGNYALTSDFSIEISRRGSFLIAHPTGQSRLRLRAMRDAKFEIEEGMGTLTFIKGLNGKVDRLLLTHEGKEQVGNKVPPSAK